MKAAVILPAAGIGKRFTQGAGQGGLPGEAGASGTSGASSKLELSLAGKPVFLRAVELFLGRPEVTQILLAVHPDRLEEFDLRYGDALRFHGVQVVPGGRIERWETVANALGHVDSACTHIAVHDAARPLTSSALLDRVFAAAAEHDAVVPGVAVTQTLKRVEPMPESAGVERDPLDAILGDAGKAVQPGDLRRVVETVDRAALVAVQTPQIFEAALLRRAYAELGGGGQASAVTDDASLVEALGETVVVVEGEPTNLKITQAADAELAGAIVAQREAQHAELSRKRLFADDEDDE